MARCADCDRFLTEVDRAAMRRVNDEYTDHGASPLYPLDDPDTVEDLHCDECIEHASEQAAIRSDEDYYGGSSPTLNELTDASRRVK